MKSSWGGGGWGTWHTGPAADTSCPQGCPTRHSEAEAIRLNQEARDRQNAALRAAHERWLGKEKPPDPEGPRG